jgi:hypothetical protein
MIESGRAVLRLQALRSPKEGHVHKHRVTTQRG